VEASDTVICIHVAFNCKFCWYYQFLTRAQWLTLAQQNLRNAYRAADQQYRPEVEVTYSLSRIFIRELQVSDIIS
jgi:hypothetical protein